ncbi:MAG: hypothetical protein B6I20_01790 [Bacteroidetes bacterium 4572_117]|nr:MAG: hypothetical protein B6I20_01790 [Bacteroidetes bacterium 4572_117]
MEINYTTSLPDKNEYYSLFESTGWNKEYKLDKEQVFKTLLNSWFLVSAYKEEKLVGFGRVISDGVMHALILDMIILPEFQRNGIGSVILAKLKEKCVSHNIFDIQLFSAKGKAGFYKNHGFSCRPENAPGMEIKLGLAQTK